MKSYNDVEQYFEQYINYECNLDTLAYDPKTFNLDSFCEFVDLLGNPQEEFPSIHIAGTKGKGSVAAMLEAALLNAGFHTGLYTSPHLASYCERFRLDGAPISEGLFVRYANILRDAISASAAPLQKRYRTVFELLTALAFLCFRDEKVDVAIIETGLGGRLDSTNVISPILCIITTLGLDHTDLLGSEITDIAREKVGIIKDGVPCVVSHQSQQFENRVMPVLTSTAYAQSAEIIRSEEMVRLEQMEKVHFGQTPDFKAGQRLVIDVRSFGHFEVFIPLMGEHQAENARTAVAALRQLKTGGLLDFDMDKAISGLANTKWRGRIEVACAKPLVVIDGAHCPLSAAALRDTLEEWFPHRLRILLLGILKGKNARGIWDELKKDQGLREVILFTPSTPRALPAENLAKIVCPDYPDAMVLDSLKSAMQHAISLVSDSEMIVVAGSLYNVAPAENFFGFDKADSQG